MGHVPDKIWLYFLGVYEAMRWGKKRLMLVWWCHQLLSGFLTKDPLIRVSCQSRLSSNDMIPGVVRRSHGILLTSRRPYYESYTSSHRLKWNPFSPNEVRRIAQHVSKERRKWWGGIGNNRFSESNLLSILEYKTFNSTSTFK